MHAWTLVHQLNTQKTHVASFDAIIHCAALMRQGIWSALVHIMVVTYSVPSHYVNQCWVIVNWTLRNKLQWNFNKKGKLFVHENASETIVCEMVDILSRERWVNYYDMKTSWPSNDSRVIGPLWSVTGHRWMDSSYKGPLTKDLNQLVYKQSSYWQLPKKYNQNTFLLIRWPNSIDIFHTI